MPQNTTTDETDKAPVSDHAGPPLSDHESEAVGHLARAISGVTTALKAVASGRELHAPYTLEPLGWTGESLSEYDKLARASRERERRQKGGRNIDQTAEEGGSMTREAVRRLSAVAESVTQALEALAAGASLSSADGLRYVVMADGQLADVVRMIPEEEYAEVLRKLSGREAPPVRRRWGV
ncbi:hypothetical protein LB565_24875 [Mesorhizobium sp. CA14]|uniref:hypothetical protein n=1 Tax=Mesorhizobium sp. CA14 TaxID=2876642 RepID=UPI001CCE2B1C|nr:hypothetical protein [Mesorhizobium sp. CA14]MBZ9851226.1 hypothetical protein [Mesorhizobium sp. CA14]